ncbi:protein SEED AND ROOT HAIR PROTECTIVE PROTEIN-like [Cornus florida]|uniref:protein SEED AND ROOT HAIR PROTECTIVE PROTEIN-like n=1 Tax=Cornus florida TaxID=4283 RepID=UPI00289759C3|nr:protein SEED AND ROOT HAIR PROTECTIVE PROTEIN-like [Cornus florida]
MAFRALSLAISVLLLSLAVNVVASSASGYDYSPKPELYHKPKTEDNNPFIPKTIGIQGLVYCKSGVKVIPLQGAVARITCLAVDQNRYESAPFSFLSDPADAKGYFFGTLSPSEIEDEWKLIECKAFLENSPLQTCKVPTDVNNGISGAVLSSYTLLNDNHMKLYSVGPFVYTSESNPGF